jgi:rRNA maturation protein Nop10
MDPFDQFDSIDPVDGGGKDGGEMEAEYTVNCPECGDYFHLLFEGEETPRTIHGECPFCGHVADHPVAED